MTPSPKRTVNPVPENCHAVTPYLIVHGVPRLLDFLIKAFGAEITEKMDAPDGTVRHAEVRIADSLVMMGEAGGPNPARPSTLYLYVPEVDQTFKRALAAGAKSLSEPKDQFYGDRSGGVEDPSGNHWYIATHVEDVSREEMQRRFAAMAR